MPFARQVLKSVLDAATPQRMLMVRGPRTHALRAIALTFDDGPHPVETSRVLDRLAEFGMAATFFVVGKHARRYPELVRRIVDEGHALGNHTYSHDAAQRAPTRVFLGEVDRTRRLLEDLTGQACALFRPPRGQLTPARLLALWGRGETIVLWNRDPRDYRMQQSDEIMAWSRLYRPEAGDVVLLHDVYPGTAGAVSCLSQRAVEDGVEFVRIADWLAGRPSTSSARVPWEAGSVGSVV